MDDIGGNMKLHTVIDEYNKKYIDIVLSLLNNIKDTLGIGTIQDSQSSSSKVDVTIVIGKDY